VRRTTRHGRRPYARPVRRPPSAWSRPLDLGIAATFVVAAAIEVIVRGHGRAAWFAIALPAVLLWGVLAVRRSHPLLTVAVVCAGGVAASLLEAWFAPDVPTTSAVGVVGLTVASYSLGAFATRRRLLVGAPLPALTILVVDLLQPADEPLAQAVPFAVCFVVVAPVIAGRLVRSHETAIARLRVQSAELAEHRAQQVAAEIARDRLELSELFHARLLGGMSQLAAEVDRTLTSCDEAGVVGLEDSARSLLAETRTVVVTLASAADADGQRPTAGPPPGDEPLRDEPPRDVANPRQAQTWAVLAAAAIAVGLAIELHTLPLRVPMPTALLACVVVVVPLALVWRDALVASSALWALAALFGVVVAPLSSSTAAVGLLVAAPFAVAALSGRARAVVGLAVSWAGTVAVFHSGDVGGALLVSLLAWLGGLVLRDRIVLASRLRHNAGLLETQRAELAQRGVLEQRTALARELHDSVGHSLTVVALQAGAARRLLATDPRRAAEVLRTIESVVTPVLADLRTGWATAWPEPRPAGADDPSGADPIGTLVAGARAAGLALDVEMDDALARIDPVLAHTVYRVLQECLTNVLRHAPGAATRVTVRASESRLELTAQNGPAPAGDFGPGSGHGLAGMRDRVAASGGVLTWRSRPDGGFAVHATLPIAPVAS
jgi:signal transduction histidine kinase